MLDEFVWGKVGRISPEAPVPVVEVTGESFYPGGAANVARNLREFIDHVARHRHDRAGPRAANSFANFWPNKRSTPRLLDRGPRFSHHRQNPDHCATSTSRAGRSRENRWRRSAKQIAKVVAARSQQCLPEIDAIIFEDYGKGFLADRTRLGKLRATAAQPARKCRGRSESRAI